VESFVFLWDSDYDCDSMVRKFRTPGPGPKFTNDLMTILRQFLDLLQSYDNCRIHETFMIILGHIL